MSQQSVNDLAKATSVLEADEVERASMHDVGSGIEDDSDDSCSLQSEVDGNPAHQSID